MTSKLLPKTALGKHLGSTFKAAHYAAGRRRAASETKRNEVA